MKRVVYLGLIAGCFFSAYVAVAHATSAAANPPIKPTSNLKQAASAKDVETLTQAPKTMQELLDSATQSLQQSTSKSQSLIEAFAEDSEIQSVLLKDAQNALQAAQQRGDKLSLDIEQNKQAIIALQAERDVRAQYLGNYYDVVREQAAKQYGALSASIIRAEYPLNMEKIASLARNKNGAIPDIKQVQGLYLNYLKEIVASGEISRFVSPVQDSQGRVQELNIIRIGVFNLIGDEQYLYYDERSNKIVPTNSDLTDAQNSLLQAFTQEISNQSGKYAAIYLDPLRGTTLALSQHKRKLQEQYNEGSNWPRWILGLFTLSTLIGIAFFGLVIWTLFAALKYFRNTNT